MFKILIHFTHGLGDAVQLTSVFQHLHKYRPDWELYLQALRGKHSVGYGYCKRIWHDQEPSPDHGAFRHVFSLGWFENYNHYVDTTNSKVTNCLREVFGIMPDPDLLTYKLNVSETAKEITAAYLRSIGCVKRPDGRFNAAILHYLGNTSTHKKNISDADAASWCRALLEAGMVPVILDWDRRSPVPDERSIFCPGVGPADIWGGFGSGDAERLAALISQVSLFAGIDSGPQKCAAATNTPSVGIWTGHSPIQFFDHARNFVHLLAENWREIPPCQHPGVAAYQAKHYPLETYRQGRLAERLIEVSLALLGQGLPEKPGPTFDQLVWQDGFLVPAFRPEQSTVIIKDIYAGDAYKTQLRPKKEGLEYVVDLGANIGTFSRLWHERNPEARIVAVEAASELMPALEANVGDFATIVNAACTYENEDVFLLSTLNEFGQSLGGSRVVKRAELDGESDPQYTRTHTPLAKMTLHEIMAKYDFPRIDILKLDVEGSEYSILDNAPLDKIGTIFCESHGHDRFQELLGRRFQGWDVGHMSMSADGIFSNWHIVNPRA